ncbi:MAG: MFS transporter [Proteobacteria bacterium]|nr:MFS transporter [Pseudomonadota bacterium]
MAQTIEGYVGAAMDDARLSPIHYRVFALIAAGYFFDVSNFIVLGALVPNMIQSHFLTVGQVATVASAQTFGMFVGAVGQGEFTDRWGRKAVYQFNLLLFGVATILSAFTPNYAWLALLRFIAGVGLGAEQPLCFAYAGEYAPKRIRGRVLAGIQLIGGALVWPLSTLFALYALGPIGWRGIWIVLGVGALIVFVLRFSLPESPRWLATHGQGKRAVELLERIGLGRPAPGLELTSDAASNTHRDPFAVVFRDYPVRMLASMFCFVAFLGVAIGLGVWLPNIMARSGMTITKSLTYTLIIQISFPCASLFMMYGLERFGRKPVAMISFVLAGLFAAGFANATSGTMLLIVGFWMMFFIQLAGNSAQIFASEVFPTNARASGFGMASGTGRLATAFIIPAILWIENGYGVAAVFGSVAVLLVIAAGSVTLMGPEARGLSLDVIAPPTG